MKHAKLIIQCMRSYAYFASESTLNKVPKWNRQSLFFPAYEQYLDTIKNSPAVKIRRGAIVFPLETFGAFPNTTMNEIIKRTFEIINENAPVEEVKVLFRSMVIEYAKFGIKADCKKFYEQAKMYNLVSHQEVVHNLSMMLADEGDVETISEILKLLKTPFKEDKDVTGQELSKFTNIKLNMYAALFRTGKIEESKEFLQQNGIDFDSVKCVIERAYVYADMKDMGNLIKEVKIIQEHRQEGVIYNVVERLIRASSDFDNVKKVLNFCQFKNSLLRKTVFALNRNKFYSDSVKLLTYIQKELDMSAILRLIDSYNQPDCPVNTYFAMLNILMPRLNDSPGVYHLFQHIDFDEVLSNMNKNPKLWSMCNVILSSILTSAIRTGGDPIDRLRRTLTACTKHIDPFKLYITLFYNFSEILYSQTVDLAVNREAVLDALVEFRPILLPVLMLRDLACNDMDQFDALEHRYLQSASQPLLHIGEKIELPAKLIGIAIAKYVPLYRIPQLLERVERVFPPPLAALLTEIIITQRLLQAVGNKDENLIQTTVDFAQEHDIKIQMEHSTDLLIRGDIYRHIYECILISDEKIYTNTNH